jgi:hypothetical protein
LSEVKLRVGDLRQKDVGRGIARIDQQTMQKLGISAGDVIEIVNKRATSAIAWPANKEDQNRDIIRIDGFTRKNSGVAINEYVVIRLAKIEIALSITLAPVDMRLNVDEDFTNFVKNRLMERTLVEGDTTLVIMLGHAIPFLVLQTNPAGVVKIDSQSQITVLNEQTSKDSGVNQMSEKQASSSWTSCAETLRELSDETFEKLIETVMTNFFFDWEQFKSEEIAKETDTTKELVEATIIFLKGLIFRNLAGNISVKSLQSLLLNDGKFSQTKVDAYVKHFQRNKNELQFTLMFSFIQDVNAKLEATTKSEYFPAIAARLTELKELYGHVLDVCTSTKEEVYALRELAKNNKQALSEETKREEPKKKKLW